MKVLIVGLGYAGTRFLEAFKSIDNSDIHITYVDKKKTREDIPFFPNITAALSQIKPDVVVVSVTDGDHAEVLLQLKGYKGFIICEKPLVNVNDDLSLLTNSLRNISGFCMDMVERYSRTTEFLKSYVKEEKLRLIRANFMWGKDRINDKRATTGVISEIIHPIDLIQWIVDPQTKFDLKNSLGTASDFSVSGNNILDSVFITALMDKAVITGYSSFVNIVRQRTVDFIFSAPNQKLIYAHMVFDTPCWDIDSLRIWERTSCDDKIITDFVTEFPKAPKNLNTIQKLRKLVSDVASFVATEKEPVRPFVTLAESISLQKLLNKITDITLVAPPSQYVLGERRLFFYDEGLS